MHSLTKSAIFFTVGHISQVKGTQKLSEIRGLTESHPLLGWGLVLGVVAIAGLPPLGIFMSEFLIVSSTFAREPLLALPLVFGLLIALGALFLRLTDVAFGKPTGSDLNGEIAVCYGDQLVMEPNQAHLFRNKATIVLQGSFSKSRTGERVSSEFSKR